MGKSKGPLTEAELKERHEYKRKLKEIEDKLDDEEFREELRIPRCRNDDEE